MIQQKITEIAEILGWNVDFSEPQNGKTDVNFAKYTSYGQDFNFSVELEDDDMEAFIDNIHEVKFSLVFLQCDIYVRLYMF